MSVLDLEIADLTLDGRGVARHRGKAVFVQGALPGEQVRARILRRHPSYDEASCLEHLHTSRDRQIPRCRHFGHCGGCTLQMLTSERQIELKTQAVLGILARVGSIRPARLEPPARSDPWSYRRRARLHARSTAAGTVFGFQPLQGSRVVPIEICPILESPLEDLPGRLGRILGPLPIARRIEAIELLSGEGNHALVFEFRGAITAPDRTALIEMGRTLGLPHSEPGADPLHILVLAENPGTFSYRIGRFDVVIEFGVSDFIQINRAINLALIDDVVGWLTEGPVERVLDLYAGVGNLSLPLARRMRSVTAVEGRSASVDRLMHNARLNRIENVQAAVADLNEAQDAAWSRNRYDALVLDPPRAGAGAILPLLERCNPSRVLYVSCHPGTLARDAKSLVETGGYALDRLRVYDMFPHTEHVETLAMFVRL